MRNNLLNSLHGISNSILPRSSSKSLPMPFDFSSLSKNEIKASSNLFTYDSISSEGTVSPEYALEPVSYALNKRKVLLAVRA